MWIFFFALLVSLAAPIAPLKAQTRQPVPQPFPRPGESPREAAPEPLLTNAQTVPSTSPEAPTEAMLGLPIYPTAVFLTSYDAGRGQRYYLFGTNSTFDEMVIYLQDRPGHPGRPGLRGASDPHVRGRDGSAKRAWRFRRE